MEVEDLNKKKDSKGFYCRHKLFCAQVSLTDLFSCVLQIQLEH